MDKFVSDKLEEWKLTGLKDIFEGKTCLLGRV